MKASNDLFAVPQFMGGGGGGGGGRGSETSRLPHPALPAPAPFRSHSRLCVLFLLRNIVPMLRNFSNFSRLPPPLDIPPLVDFPPPITPGLPLPVPPPTITGERLFALGRSYCSEVAGCVVTTEHLITPGGAQRNT